jgi:ParB-like chromosome segregation protein Spo0J
MSKRLNTPSLSIEILPVKDLLPYQRALRKNAKAVERMVASIREYGFKIPLLVSEQRSSSTASFASKQRRS